MQNKTGEKKVYEYKVRPLTFVPMHSMQESKAYYTRAYTHRPVFVHHNTQKYIFLTKCVKNAGLTHMRVRAHPATRIHQRKKKAKHPKRVKNREAERQRRSVTASEPRFAATHSAKQVTTDEDK